MGISLGESVKGIQVFEVQFRQREIKIVVLEKKILQERQFNRQVKLKELKQKLENLI